MRKNPEKRLGSGANDSDEVMRQGFFRVWLLFFLSFFLSFHTGQAAEAA